MNPPSPCIRRLFSATLIMTQKFRTQLIHVSFARYPAFYNTFLTCFWCRWKEGSRILGTWSPPHPHPPNTHTRPKWALMAMRSVIWEKLNHLKLRVPTQPGKPGKWQYTCKTWKYHGILKKLINIMGKWHETWKTWWLLKIHPWLPWNNI